MDDAQRQLILRRIAELEAKAQGPEIDDPGFVGSAMIGAGKATDRIIKGAQQLWYGAQGTPEARKKLDALAANVAEEDRLYKPLAEMRPVATGLGEALPSMAVPVGGATTVLGKVGSMALAGALPGLLEYGDAGERLKRGAIGGVAGAALPAGVAGFKTLRAMAEPLTQAGQGRIIGRTLNRAAGENADQVAQRMATASELVPGSAPTAGQVAQSGGIAALERAAAAANPEAYTTRAMEQSSARLNALRGIAQDDAALALAEAERASAKAGAYAKADMGVAQLDSTFNSLLDRPQFASAVKRAQELAKDEGLSDIFFRGSNGQPVALIGRGAHFIKKALDEAGEFGSKSWSGKASATNAGRTKDIFLGWLDNSIPEYKQAASIYAKKSEPINQMQVGRSLLDSVSPALADYGALGRETAATYARALRNADQVAAKATNMSGAKMANVMTPGQMSTIEAVGKDLGRKANAQDLGRGVGSDTFQKLSMQNLAQQSGMPGLAGGLLGLPGVSRATSWAYREADQKMQQALADILLDPKKAAEIMRKMAPAQRGLLAQQAQNLLASSSARLGLLPVPLVSQSVAPN